MKAVGGVVILFIALAVGVLFLDSYIVFLNVTDIMHKGLNFWNTFWLFLVTATLFASTRTSK